MWMHKQSKYENMAYVALWSLLFAAPLLSLFVRTAGDSELSFNWQEVFMVWGYLSIFLLLFLIHNFILAPLLIYRNKRWLYAVLTVCMVGLFAFYQCSNRPPMKRDFNHEPPPFEHHLLSTMSGASKSILTAALALIVICHQSLWASATSSISSSSS